MREEPVRCCMVRRELVWDWQSPLGSLKPQGAAQGANAVTLAALDKARLLKGRVRVGIEPLAGLEAEFALLDIAPKQG